MEFSRRLFYDRRPIGPSLEAFRAARAADPNAKLYLSEYNAEAVGAKSDALFQLVASLRAQGVPIDGVAFQGHFVVGQIPTTWQQNLQRFSNLGVDVSVSELDIRMVLPVTTEKESQQATDYLKVVRKKTAHNTYGMPP